VPLGIGLGGQQKSSKSATGAVLHPVATVSTNAAKYLMEGVIASPRKPAKATSEEGKQPSGRKLPEGQRYRYGAGAVIRRFTIKVA
jgi:hypothetical protein